MIPFEERLEGSTLTSFKEMWGNNGDIVSKQYTGTVAMKVSAWALCTCMLHAAGVNFAFSACFLCVFTLIIAYSLLLYCTINY